MRRQRILIHVAACVLGVTLCVAPAQATLGDYAREWTQILNHAQLVDAYIRQGEQLRQQIIGILDQAKNTLNLPFQVFGPILAEIGAFHSVVREGQALAYSMGNLDAEFARRFRTWGYQPDTWYQQYQLWSRTNRDGALNVLKAANLQANQMMSEEQVLRQLRTMSQSSQGRMQAAQVGLQLAEQQVQQLQKLRLLMMADIQSKVDFQAWQVQQASDTAAGQQRFFTNGPARTDPKTYLGGAR
jgi:type IV secretion system protein TrbJ